MKSKKRRFLIITLILFLVILLLFMIYALRNALILSNIDKMVTNLENNNQNIYAKIVTNDISGNITSSEHFLKDNVYKRVTKLDNPATNNIDLIVTTFTYPSSQKVFTEIGDNRTLSINDSIKTPVRGYHVDNATYAIIMNIGHNENFFIQGLASISSNIKTVEIDGKEYYLIKNFISSDYMYDTDAKEIVAYVEKDTGLPFKIVETLEKDGATFEKISSFEYKFDYVTDSDMIEPDETMFSIHED